MASSLSKGLFKFVLPYSLRVLGRKERIQNNLSTIDDPSALVCRRTVFETGGRVLRFCSGSSTGDADAFRLITPELYIAATDVTLNVLHGRSDEPINARASLLIGCGGPYPTHSTSPLIVITCRSRGICFPDASIAFFTIQSKPEQQGTSMWATVIHITSLFFNIAANFFT